MKEFAFVSTMEGNPWGGSEELWSQVQRLREFRRAIALNPEYGPALENIQRLERMGIR